MITHQNHINTLSVVVITKWTTEIQSLKIVTIRLVHSNILSIEMMTIQVELIQNT